MKLLGTQLYRRQVRASLAPKETDRWLAQTGSKSAAERKKALSRLEQQRRRYLGANSEEGAISARFFFLQFCNGSPTSSHVSRGEWRKSSTGIIFASLSPEI